MKGLLAVFLFASIVLVVYGDGSIMREAANDLHDYGETDNEEGHVITIQRAQLESAEIHIHREIKENEETENHESDHHHKGCRCAFYLRTKDPQTGEERDTPESEEYPVNGFNCDVKDADRKCGDYCADEIGKATNDADLNHTIKPDGKKVGQLLCDHLQRDVDREWPVLYAGGCEKDKIQPTEHKTKQPLCCKREQVYSAYEYRECDKH